MRVRFGRDAAMMQVTCFFQMMGPLEWHLCGFSTQLISAIRNLHPVKPSAIAVLIPHTHPLSFSNLAALATPDRTTIKVYYSLSHYHPFGKCHFQKDAKANQALKDSQKGCMSHTMKQSEFLLVTSLPDRLGWCRTKNKVPSDIGWVPSFLSWALIILNSSMHHQWLFRPLHLGMAIQHWLFNRNLPYTVKHWRSQSLNTNAKALRVFM